MSHLGNGSPEARPAGSTSEQRRGCRAGSSLWCPLGPRTTRCPVPLTGPPARHGGWRPASSSRVGRADPKGLRPACGCWLGLELVAYTAAQTCPGSRKGAWERVRFSLCKLPPNRTTRKLPSRHSRHPGWAQAGHPARKPATEEQGLSVRPWVPALGLEPLLLRRLGGLLGRSWFGCQAGGNGPQWPASQFLVPPYPGLGERAIWEREGGALLGMCLPPAKVAPWNFTKQADRPPQRSPGVGRGGQSWDGVSKPLSSPVFFPIRWWRS